MAIFFAMPGNERLARELAALTGGDVGEMELRCFPDGETYVRVLSDVRRADVYLVCTLASPDLQFVALAFTGATILGLGAARLQLIAPYLAYMREDRIFQSGEALTSKLFAELLQQNFNGLITVDPHLHRHATLDEIYDIPTTIVRAAPLLADWIARNVKDPVVIGPDCESAQWVEMIARDAGAPWIVFSKERRGDRHLSMKAPDLANFRGRTPVIVDDIVSSGTTLKNALRILKSKAFRPAYCLTVHELCTVPVARQIRDQTVRFLATNTVGGPDATLDVAPLIAEVLIEKAARAAA